MCSCTTAAYTEAEAARSRRRARARYRRGAAAPRPVRPAGGNHRHAASRYVADVGRSRTDHFDPDAVARETRSRRERDAARGDPGRALDVSRAVQLEAAASTHEGLKQRGVRALRPGRAVARAPDGADPRSHQRRRRRQPAREPADRLPELRRDARHALRARERGRSRSCDCAAEPTSRRRPARSSVLLAPTAASAGSAPGLPAARAAEGGERPPYEQLVAEVAALELERRRTQVRRVGQRGAQVGAGVRAATPACLATDGASAAVSSREIPPFRSDFRPDGELGFRFRVPALGWRLHAPPPARRRHGRGLPLPASTGRRRRPDHAAERGPAPACSAPATRSSRARRSRRSTSRCST